MLEKRNKAVAFVFFALVCAAISLPGTAAADDSKKPTLKVAVSEFPPMVEQNPDGSFRGFDIDLITAVAEDLGYEPEFVNGEFSDIFRKLENGEVAAGVSGISINRDREVRLDFSHHYFDSGLRIMVRSSGQLGAWDLLASVWHDGLGRWLGYFILFLCLSALLVWISERGQDAIADSWIGLPQALWFVNVTSTTVGYGDFAPKKWLGRIVAAFVMWAGIAISGILIGYISSAMTVEKMAQQSVQLDDLQGQAVATVKGTTSVDILRRVGARIVVTDNATAACDLLKHKKVKAVVFDDPALRYYALTRGNGKVAVTGNMFERQYYGIALPTGSELREPINRILTKYRENGVLEKINQRWFRNSGK